MVVLPVVRIGNLQGILAFGCDSMLKGRFVLLISDEHLILCFQVALVLLGLPNLVLLVLSQLLQQLLGNLLSLILLRQNLGLLKLGVLFVEVGVVEESANEVVYNGLIVLLVAVGKILLDLGAAQGRLHGVRSNGLNEGLTRQRFLWRSALNESLKKLRQRTHALLHRSSRVLGLPKTHTLLHVSLLTQQRRQ